MGAALAEFVQILFADQDCARVFEPRDDGRIVLGHVVGINGRAERRLHAARADLVFDAERQSVRLKSPRHGKRAEIEQRIRKFASPLRGAERYDIEEIIDLDESSVLLVANHYASGRKSGVEVRDEVVWLYRFGGGKITNVEGYETRAQALEALGR